VKTQATSLEDGTRSVAGVHQWLVELRSY